MTLKPTHGYISNGASAWLSEFREELPGFLENFVGKMDESIDGLPPTEYVIIYKLKPGADQWEPEDYDEYIQAGGRADRMTVELRLANETGFTLFKIGHPTNAPAPAMTEVEVAGNTFPVQENEVLNSDDAIKLVEHFYDHNDIAPGWSVRPILWFDSDGNAVDEPAGSTSDIRPSPESEIEDNGETTRTTTKGSNEDTAKQNPADSTQLNL